VKKYKRTFNPNLIKKDLSYTAKDIVDLLGVHIQTVRGWHKEGLKRIDDTQPYLFHGSHLKAFIKQRQAKRKHKCQSDEFYCFKCRKPKKAWENAVDLFIKNEKKLNIQGICSLCNSTLNKRDTVKNLKKIHSIFNVLKIHNKHLIESVATSVITH